MKNWRDLLKILRRSFLYLGGRTPQMDHSERYCYNPVLRWNPQVEEYFIKAYGAEHFSKISNALTCPSCYSCIRVNTLKTTGDAVIERLSAMLHGTELRNSVDDLCKAELDMNQQDNNLPKEFDSLHIQDTCTLKERLQSNPIFKCQLPGLDYVLFVRGSGPYSIDYGFAPDKPPKEIIVSRKCAEAVLRGAQVYVPGVLACSAHVEKGDVVAVSVAVEQPCLDGGWGVGITRGTVLQGLPTDAQYLERNGLYIGQGTAMMSRAGIFRVPNGIAVDMNNRVFRLPPLHDVLEGEIFLQNLPSIITAHALDPQQGERILDMCAAPGGKTTAIAILMKDEGQIVAVDRSHNKVLDIQKLAGEMGLKCITTFKLDSTRSVARKTELFQLAEAKNSSDDIQKSVSVRSETVDAVPVITAGLSTDCPRKENDCSEEESPGAYLSKADRRKHNRRMKNGPGRNQSMGGRVEKSKGFSTNSFDRVLLDAPCSALGLRPRLFAGEETLHSLRSHGKYQRRLFDQAVQLVRPGGVIVYSTCTINPGENEALVRYALDTYKFLSLAAQHPRIGGPGLVGYHEFADGYTEEWLKPGEEELVQRFDPSSPLDTIGFFIAKFNVGTKES